jgi:decaprenylphospho-beta-D-ribofuranose 2-oxidase
MGPTIIEDVSRLNPAEVSVVCPIQGGSDWDRAEGQIRAALAFAAEHELTVSIAAQRHSQGGQVSHPGALLLDLDDYRGVELTEAQRGARIVRVLSGTTWAEVQDAAHGEGLRPESYAAGFAQREADPEAYRPSSLAVKVQQSSNIFSVGGSLSVNCHGRDKAFGDIISTVRSFRIMLADGRVVTASRSAPVGSEEARLFRAAIGGYGLFGVILDVELELQDNLMVEKHTTLLDYTAYVDVLTRDVLPDAGVALHFGRLNIDDLNRDDYLREMYVVDYRATGRIEEHLPLSTEKDSGLVGAFMELGEWSELAKKLRWEALLTRVDVPGRVELTTLNNAMRPPVQFLLERKGIRKVNILQEYFIPPDAFVSFVDGLRTTALSDGIDLQNVTTRFVAGNDESLLSYAPDDRIALVLYVNIWLTEAGIEAARSWTRELVDQAQALGGSYYLTYQRWPTRAQLDRSYPRFDLFLTEKDYFDPSGRFTNQFHAQYSATE